MVRILALLIAAPLAAAGLAQSASVPQTNSADITADGTAHITRIVPLPTDLSPEARAHYAKPGDGKAAGEADIARRRAATDAWQSGAGKASLAVYPVKVSDGNMGGVPVRLIDPLPETDAAALRGPGNRVHDPRTDPLHYSVFSHARQQPTPVLDANGKPTGAILVPRSGFSYDVPMPTPVSTDRVLLNLHGGGFDSDSGSLTESIPIANLTRTRVVAALYRLAPEHPYPAAVDDAVAVYRELLKAYKPERIAVYGTSAGAILTAELAVRLKQLNLPEPGALGIFSGFGDVGHTTDSTALYALNGFSGRLELPPSGTPKPIPHYYGSASPTDPVVSPNLGDLHGLPPTLFVTSSRDLLLSGTANMQRAWRRDGVPTEMTMFDGLPHAFWNDVSLPESREAYAVMAEFFLRQTGR